MTSTRVLVLGAEGIAGSALMREMAQAQGTTRRASAPTDDPRIIAGIDITSRADLERALDRASPEVVINCAGIVKSECDKHPPARVVAVNAEAPHLIADVAVSAGCRVIHLSTDCVYDGSTGNRVEEDSTDATDLYGQTKAAGEIVGYEFLTLRTSFIGRDPRYGRGLVEWLLAGRDEVVGYAGALWSGLSAPELARVIARVVREFPRLCGLYHVSGPIVSKAELLEILIWTHQLPRWVRREREPRIDRTLDGSRFHEATGYEPPSWIAMAKEMAQIENENGVLP